jgi:type IV secretion system protein TrbC
MISSRIKTAFISTAAFMLLTVNTFASETDSLPWSQPMSKFADSLSGPGARFIALAVLFVTGGMMAFGDFAGATKKMLGAVMGLAVVLGGSGWLNSLFNFTGALIN